ncbi:hypothetical protein MKZ38_005629 [Zalerion maritima]|uniref:Uncharacterized protein n=1 Tax=Zalerion maritima TaxID=339359 RepID=A0AAD5WP57_9PEZI|nr:hypothetical protein MKZ38_005629 [Zalerion maritima]
MFQNINSWLRLVDTLASATFRSTAIYHNHIGTEDQAALFGESPPLVMPNFRLSQRSPLRKLSGATIRLGDGVGRGARRHLGDLTRYEPATQQRGEANRLLDWAALATSRLFVLSREGRDQELIGKARPRTVWTAGLCQGIFLSHWLKGEPAGTRTNNKPVHILVIDRIKIDNLPSTCDELDWGRLRQVWPDGASSTRIADRRAELFGNRWACTIPTKQTFRFIGAGGQLAAESRSEQFSGPVIIPDCFRVSDLLGLYSEPAKPSFNTALLDWQYAEAQATPPKPTVHYVLPQMDWPEYPIQADNNSLPLAMESIREAACETSTSVLTFIIPATECSPTLASENIGMHPGAIQSQR